MSHNHEHTGRNLAITVILNGIITIGQFYWWYYLRKSGPYFRCPAQPQRCNFSHTRLFGASDRTSATKSEVDVWIQESRDTCCIHQCDNINCHLGLFDG